MNLLSSLVVYTAEPASVKQADRNKKVDESLTTEIDPSSVL